MAEETQYTANTGMVTISTANSNLDGTGTLGTVFTAGANGSLIKTVTIKAQGDSTQGMIRLFIVGGGNTRLFREIEVQAVDSSGINPRYEFHFDLDFALQSGYVLKASTENAESFNVIVEALDWAYYSSSVRTDTTQYTANTGIATLTTATAGVSLITAGSNGCSIESITIKATESPTDGIIGIYVYDGVATALLYSEVKVNAVTHSDVAHSFEYNLVFENDFDLKSGYSLAVVTYQTQSFSVIAEALNWTYPA